MNDLQMKMKALKEIFPEDERLRNAVLMAMGCCEQIPPMNEAFRVQLLDLPKPNETVEWENLVHLALSDVLGWSARLELALQDLRAALFFRYNNRMKKIDIPTPEELETAKTKIEDEVQRNSSRAAAKKALETPALEKPKVDPVAAAKKISDLFGGLGKK